MHTWFAATTTIWALALASAPVGETEAGSPENASTKVPDDWKPLHDRWQKAMDELKIPGLAVVAVRGDEVVLLDVLGVCDPAGKQRVTPRSPFYLASVTKSFTALGVAILVDEGKVKLDEPVKTYLPRFTLVDPERAATITVRDLLCHRYGLNSSPISLGEAYFGNMTDDRYYALLKSVQPQRDFAYSNLHYTLLGRVIEAATGKPWKDFLAERVFSPLGMRDTTCYASRLYANPLAAWPFGNRVDKWELASQVKQDAVMHAAGGMGASASDLGNWLVFQLTGQTADGRQLVSSTLLDETHKKQASHTRAMKGPGGFTRDGYTLGWFTGTFRGHAMLEHGGGYLGTATLVSMLPEEKLGVAVLVNQSRPGIPLMIAVDVYGKLLGETVEDLLPRVREGSARMQERLAAVEERTWQAPDANNGLSQPLERYLGKYQSPIFGEGTVSSNDGKLHLQVGILPLRWQAMGEDQFEIEVPGGDVTKGQFKLNGEGQVMGFAVVTPLGEMEFRKVE